METFDIFDGGYEALIAHLRERFEARSAPAFEVGLAGGLNPVLTFRTADQYVTAVNGVVIPEGQENYQAFAIDVGPGTMNASMIWDSLHIDTAQLGAKRSTLETLFFITAEAARFRVIEHGVTQVIHGGRSHTNVLDLRRAIHLCKNYSKIRQMRGIHASRFQPLTSADVTFFLDEARLQPNQRRIPFYFSAKDYIYRER